MLIFACQGCAPSPNQRMHAGPVYWCLRKEFQTLLCLRDIVALSWRHPCGPRAEKSWICSVWNQNKERRDGSESWILNYLPGFVVFMCRLWSCLLCLRSILCQKPSISSGGGHRVYDLNNVKHLRDLCICLKYETSIHFALWWLFSILMWLIMVFYQFWFAVFILKLQRDYRYFGW